MAKYLFRNRYIRCLHSARKILLEYGGKKVLITDNTREDDIGSFTVWGDYCNADKKLLY